MVRTPEEAVKAACGGSGEHARERAREEAAPLSLRGVSVIFREGLLFRTNDQGGDMHCVEEKAIAYEGWT
jgi:hypothetical protein